MSSTSSTTLTLYRQHGGRRLHTVGNLAGGVGRQALRCEELESCRVDAPHPVEVVEDVLDPSRLCRSCGEDLALFLERVTGRDTAGGQWVQIVYTTDEAERPVAPVAQLVLSRAQATTSPQKLQRPLLTQTDPELRRQFRTSHQQLVFLDPATTTAAGAAWYGGPVASSWRVQRLSLNQAYTAADLEVAEVAAKLRSTTDPVLGDIAAAFDAAARLLSR